MLFLQLNDNPKPNATLIMRGRIRKEGEGELFETTKGNQILNLDDEQYYALVEGQQGDIIVKSDSDHEKKRSLSKGKFYFVDFDDDPEFQDMPHLFIEEGDQYREFILPRGLPDSNDHQKKLIRSDDMIPKSKVRDHVEGKGDKGSEKQYSDKPEGLRNKTKEELYNLAQEQKIEGRSKMNKEELIKNLAQKK